MAKVNLSRISHVYYMYKDLDTAHLFLLDFGLLEVERRAGRIFYRGYGTEHFVFCAQKGDNDVFGGAAFAVKTLQDLGRASGLPGATPIRDLEPGLVGAGKAHRGTQPFNYPIDKNREPGPATVHKLGHFGISTLDFARTFKFFTENFIFAPSDLIHDESGRDVATFLHLDRGKEKVGHHCFFFYEGSKPHVHHSSYEVYDFDTQALGHYWLKQKGYQTCWGVGRHVLGSQIFDYWQFIMEHYVDGDMVNSDTPMAKSKLGKEGLFVWGPDVPSDFLE
ncbi:Glyoxalase/Bleomycin resistance protein/Dihydroxybiphenyl dioxygenase [Xylaria sp. FL0933]|nr:Glyoxalase/Bleomycin resistance protein/Dihydroxybiphenyl dioxygenase [Xylaria sp. FL0933]